MHPICFARVASAPDALHPVRARPARGVPLNQSLLEGYEAHPCRLRIAGRSVTNRRPYLLR